MLPELLLPNQENLELLLPELEDASEPEELLAFVVDFSEVCPWKSRLVPAEPPYGLLVELLPVCPGLLKLDPLELLLLLLGFDPKNDKIPPFDPGLLSLVLLELLELAE